MITSQALTRLRGPSSLSLLGIKPVRRLSSLQRSRGEQRSHGNRIAERKRDAPSKGQVRPFVSRSLHLCLLSSRKNLSGLSAAKSSTHSTARMSSSVSRDRALPSRTCHSAGKIRHRLNHLLKDLRQSTTSQRASSNLFRNSLADRNETNTDASLKLNPGTKTRSNTVAHLKSRQVSSPGNLHSNSKGEPRTGRLNDLSLKSRLRAANNKKRRDSQKTSSRQACGATSGGCSTSCSTRKSPSQTRLTGSSTSSSRASHLTHTRNT